MTDASSRSRSRLTPPPRPGWRPRRRSASGRVPNDREVLPGILIRPANLVSWHEAMAFCRRLTEVWPESLAGYGLRLPTTAGWEESARGGGCLPAATSGVL